MTPQEIDHWADRLAHAIDPDIRAAKPALIAMVREAMAFRVELARIGHCHVCGDVLMSLPDGRCDVHAGFDPGECGEGDDECQCMYCTQRLQAKDDFSVAAIGAVRTELDEARTHLHNALANAQVAVNSALIQRDAALAFLRRMTEEVDASACPSDLLTEARAIVASGTMGGLP